jgi:hypothetical protein
MNAEWLNRVDAYHAAVLADSTRLTICVRV